MTKCIHHLGNPEDSTRKEYIITLKDHNDSDGFYDDMETEGGSITIPGRACECLNRRPISRNTHYHLTYEEAKQVLEDDRVLAVELTPSELGLKPIPYSWTTSSSNFSKKTASDGNDINWGFIRSLSLTNPSNWGTGGNISLSDTITCELSGKNVDVVIADDGCPYPSTLEYQQNADGTGYTRLIQYNWFQHTNSINGNPNGTYDYSLSAVTNQPRLQEHGAHTMGTSAGNTQGWARDANIYFISFYDDNMTDYVRAFHASKPINPITGIKNPTVMNNSWGYGTTSFVSNNVSEIFYRGTTYYPTSGTAGNYVWDQTLLNNFWCTRSLTRIASVDADFEDMVNEGIIVVASAGNSNSYMDVPDGPDYNNYFILSGNIYYPHRGSTPAAAAGVINVGAAGSHNDTDGNVYNSTSIDQQDYRAEFSNFGPRVDVWASGSGIQSVWRSTDNLYDAIPAADPRVSTLNITDTENNNFKKCPGTSMSGPQVCGILACLAEAYPRMNNSDAKKYIQSFCTSNMEWTTGGILDLSDLGISKNENSETKYMYLKGHRILDSINETFSNVPYPPTSYLYRESSGVTFPRYNKIYRNNLNQTYSLSANKSSVISNGTDSVTITLNTSNVANGTKIPYIITSKYKGLGYESTPLDTGLYGVYNTNNTYSKSISGEQFGDGDGSGTTGEEKRHKINMSAASTNPTWIDDPNGFSFYDYNSPIDSNIAPAGNITITTTATGTSEYLISGSDRISSYTSSGNQDIHINYGDTLTINVNSGASHPVYIKYTAVNGGLNDQVTAGVTNQGATSGSITINTTNLVDSSGNSITFNGDGQIVLWYQCGNHSSMKGMIIVRSRIYPSLFKNTNSYFTGNTDDGNFKIKIPWNIPIFGINRKELFLSTNGYITFGGSSTAYSNFTSINLDKILLSACDGYSENYIYYVGGSSPNRFVFIDYYPSSTRSPSGPNNYYQIWLYENDVNNIYVNVLQNSNFTVRNDRYPFYQNRILGNLNTTGNFTVNSNTASITITPTVDTEIPIEESINVNLRLGYHNSPNIDFSVTQ